jgi:hypothetical protein
VWKPRCLLGGVGGEGLAAVGRSKVAGVGDRALAEAAPELVDGPHTKTTLEDFLDQLGHAIVLSHLGPAARMRS